MAQTPQERRTELMASLHFEQMDVRRKTIKNAQSTTCEWILRHSSYIGWNSRNGTLRHQGILHIFGKPGSGKSTLMKFVVQQAVKSRVEDETILSFFFNGRGNKLERTTLGMCRALLFRLLSELPDLQYILDQVSSSTLVHHPWALDELQGLFAAALRNLGRRRLKCFIDALDECDEGQFSDTIEFFEDLSESSLSEPNQLQLCFASRHYPAIRIDNGWSVILENEVGHSEDLKKYIQHQLQAGQGKPYQDVRKQVHQKAGGIFLWVVLVVDILNHDFCTGRIFAMRKRLMEIPQCFSVFLKECLHRCIDTDDLLLCFQWILFAKRALQPEELYFAMEAGLNHHHSFEQTAWKPKPWNPELTTVEDTHRFLLSISSGLAELTKSKTMPTVQFIHESVRDFLLRDGALCDMMPNVDGQSTSLSHDRLKKCCLDYLAADLSGYVSSTTTLPQASSKEGTKLRQRVRKEFPFLEYANECLFHHANEAALGVDQKDFLETFALDNWIFINNVLERYEVRRHSSSATLLYILAERDCHRLINALADTDDWLWHRLKGERYQFPVLAAFSNGAAGALKALMGKVGAAFFDGILQDPGFGKSSKLGKNQDLLLWAATNNNWTFAEYLLTCYSDREIFSILPEHQSGSRGQGILTLAARYGTGVVVNLLLGQGSEVYTYVGQYSVTLQVACAAGNEEVVRLLLGRGADVNAPGVEYSNALHAASLQGSESVVELLLRHGAIIHAMCGIYDNALQAASSAGHDGVVQLLLKWDAENKAQSRVAWLLPERVCNPTTQGRNVGFVESAVDSSARGEPVAPMIESRRDRNDQFALQAASRSAFQDSGYETRSLLDDVVTESGSVRTDNCTHEIGTDLKSALVSDFVENIVDHMESSSLKQLFKESDGLVKVQDLLRDFSKVLQPASFALIHEKALTFVWHQRNVVAHELERTINAWRPESKNEPTKQETFAAIHAWRIDSDVIPLYVGDGAKSALQEESDCRDSELWDQEQITEDLAEVQQSFLNQEQPYTQEILAARSFVLKGTEFPWLVERLQRLSIYRRTGSTFTDVRQQLANAVCRLSSTDRVVLSLDWNPVSFLCAQFQEAPPKLGATFVYCGSPEEPYITTVKNYLCMIWPTVTDVLLGCTEQLCVRAGTGSAEATMTKSSSDAVNVTMTLNHDTTTVSIGGRATTVLDLAEACVWLSVACRENVGEKCVASCIPTLYPHDADQVEIQAFSKRFNINQCADAPGYCWTDMVCNPVIASGYPIPRRGESQKGLEISFQIMAMLGHTDWATKFNSTFLLKGVISALVPVLEIETAIIWHFVLNKDQSRLSYGQTSYLANATLSHLALGDMEDRRHFVGMWTSTAQILAGTNNDGLYKFKKSQSKPVNHYSASLSTLGISVGKILAINASGALAKKDTAPPFRSSEGQWFERQIVDASNTTVLFYAQDDQRAWLLDGASALMHISRAWLSTEHYAQLVPQKVLSQICYVKGDGGKKAAIDALIENRRRNICIFTDQERRLETVYPAESSTTMASSSDADADEMGDDNVDVSTTQKQECKIVTSEWTFKHLTIEIWRTLEMMSEKLRSMDLGQPEIEIKKWRNAPILTGWEMCDVLRGKGPFLPRAVELGPNGKTWLDLAREVSSVVLIARTFGDLITPREVTAEGCGRHSKMPPKKDYLAVPLYIWKDSAWLNDNEDCSCGSVQITDYSYWHGFDPFYGPCSCADNYECNVITYLGDKHMPNRSKDVKRRPPLNVFDQYPFGAAIIGGPRKLKKRRPFARHRTDVLVTCPYRDSKTCEDDLMEGLKSDQASLRSKRLRREVPPPILDNNAENNSTLSESTYIESDVSLTTTTNTSLSQELSRRSVQSEPRFTESFASSGNARHNSSFGHVTANRRTLTRLSRKFAPTGGLREAFGQDGQMAVLLTASSDGDHGYYVDNVEGDEMEL